ncbi:hypothetical protein ACNSPU_09340 [Bacillus velezensis]
MDDLSSEWCLNGGLSSPNATECFEFVVVIVLPIFELKLQRITLAGDDFTLSEKNFTGNHLKLSAADKVNGDANRNHYLLITKGAGMRRCVH